MIFKYPPDFDSKVSVTGFFSGKTLEHFPEELGMLCFTWSHGVYLSS